MVDLLFSGLQKVALHLFHYWKQNLSNTLIWGILETFVLSSIHSGILFHCVNCADTCLFKSSAVFSLCLLTVFADKGMHFSLLLYCFLSIITAIFTFYGRKNKCSPAAMGRFVFCCEARNLKAGFSTHLSLGLMKFCKVLNWISQGLKHNWKNCRGLSSFSQYLDFKCLANSDGFIGTLAEFSKHSQSKIFKYFLSMWSAWPTLCLSSLTVRACVCFYRSQDDTIIEWFGLEVVSCNFILSW